MTITATISFELSEEQLELLSKLSYDGGAEYMNPEWPSLEDFRLQEEYMNITEEEYLINNYGGTLYSMYELESMGLVCSYGERLPVYELSDVGRQLLKKHTIIDDQISKLSEEQFKHINDLSNFTHE